MCGSVAGNWRLFPAPGLATFSGKYTPLSKNVKNVGFMIHLMREILFVNPLIKHQSERKKKDLDAIEKQISKSFFLLVFHNKII